MADHQWFISFLLFNNCFLIKLFGSLFV